MAYSGFGRKWTARIPSMTVRAACFIAMSPQLPMAWDATGAGGGRYSNGRHATLIY
ncbi:Uncharacterised protein [Mycobacteroides abscessus subsp. abscessus]|nr:Uncharacterised protein [Mycobacteroides abscessus subsp. abscessus]